MGTGRTLRKHSHTRPVKAPGEKRRRVKAQRARLVKFGMDEAVVAKMLDEQVRKLVQRPAEITKMLAKAAVKAAAQTATAPAAETESAAKAAAPKKPATKKPAAKKKPASAKAE